METKEDKKNSERNAPGVVKTSNARGAVDENLEVLGFGKKPSKN